MRELIEDMLNLDPEKRPSPSEVLKYQWLKSEDDVDSDLDDATEIHDFDHIICYDDEDRCNYTRFDY